MRTAMPALVRALWRSRVSWPLRVWMIDSMIWRRGRRSFAPGRGASVRVAGRSRVMPASLRSASNASGAVALVGDEGLPGRAMRAAAIHVRADLAFVGFPRRRAANAVGSPAGVATRCRRRPQHQRECDAQ